MLALLPWSKIAAIAAIALVGFGAGWQIENWRMSAKIGPLKAEVSRLQSRATVLEASNAQCAQSVKTQNQAIKLLESQAEKRQQRAAEAIRIARAESAKLDSTIATLRAARAPLEPSCETQAVAAARIIADEIRGRK